LFTKVVNFEHVSPIAFRCQKKYNSCGWMKP
jgi:hypothetical protein